MSFDNGTKWQSLQLNLPNTPVTDIKLTRKELVLSTQGRSFWILDNLTPLHQMDAKLAAAPAALLKPKEAIRMRIRAGGGFGRWFAIIVVAVNMIGQFAWFPAYPLWSLVVIGLSVAVLWALTAGWRDLME